MHARNGVSILVATILLSAATASAQQPGTATAAAEPASVVAAVLDAFNRHDAAGMVAHFAPSMEVVHVMGRRFTETVSAQAWQQRFTGMFQQAPDLCWELVQRSVEGPFVVDHYRTRANGRTGGEMQIYEVRDGKVVGMWHFLPAPARAREPAPSTDLSLSGMDEEQMCYEP